MSYPNLDEHIIQRSTTFFNQIDTDQDGSITLADIYNACYTHAAKHPSFMPAEPAFVDNILRLENLTVDSTLSQAEYETLQSSYPKLTDTFMLIDTNSTGSIICSDLVSHYNPVPQPFPIQPISSYWIEQVKEHENLTDESSITLEQFLSFENTYNYTRYWPLIDEL